MDPKPVHRSETENKYGPLPRPGLPVQVQCDGFKCMAVLDRQGRWIDFFTHEPLVRVFGVVRA